MDNIASNVCEARYSHSSVFHNGALFVVGGYPSLEYRPSTFEKLGLIGFISME
jgi:hypothetical protein